MKLQVIILLHLLIVLQVFGQRVQTILQGNASDSSFYHVARISDNEYWAGGEHGILKSIDSLGNVSTIKFPNLGLDILKIERINDYVYLITANATIYRYNMQQKQFSSKSFPQFNGKCFYDLIGLPNGQIMVCGGTSGIAKGEKQIPRGFIATLDQDMGEVTVVWKSFRRFVWSLLNTGNEGVMAVSFNGIKSKILKSENLKKWRKDSNVKGLVHEIALFDGSIWFSGTKNMRYKRSGIWGEKKKGNDPNIIEQMGCLWSMEKVKTNILMTSYTGEILIYNSVTHQTKHLAVAQGFSLYDMVKVSDSKVLVVGHGKGLYMLNFD